LSQPPLTPLYSALPPLPPQVFGAVVRIRDYEDRCPGAKYVEDHPQILETLFDGCAAPAGGRGPATLWPRACAAARPCPARPARGALPHARHAAPHAPLLPHPVPPCKRARRYQEPSIALNCGAMFRDCIRDEGVAR
jgi:hypothetical protein